MPKEIVWDGAYYREGGTVIWAGRLLKIKKLEVYEDRNHRNIFDWAPVLRVKTECGRTLEFEEK